MKVQKLNWRKARWALYLSRFDFTLKHMLGVGIEKADGLSRSPDQKVGTENDNKNQNLIKEEWIQEMMEIVIEESEEVIKKKIKRARRKNKEIVKVVEEMKKREV